MSLFKVELGSALYKKGVRWTECLESERIGKYAMQHMVLDHIHTISRMVMLIIIITSQVLGHTNINKNAQQANNMNKLSMNEVTMNF